MPVTCFGKLLIDTFPKIGTSDTPVNNRPSSFNNGSATINFTYDNSGNMTAAGATTYQWDGANRLKSVNGGTSGSYGFDGNGKRVKKTEGGVSTYYVYSSVIGSAVMEVANAGVQRAYVMNGGGVVAQRNADGQFYWMHPDHLGSGRKMTDTSGNLTYRAEFDPYGKLLYEWSLGNQANRNSKKFTSYERDAATGLDYAQARMYGSEWGRFMSPDPKGLASANKQSPKSFNRYSYVQGNPANATDPNGEDIVVDLRFFLTSIGSACNVYGNAFLDVGRVYCGDTLGQITKDVLNAFENQNGRNRVTKAKPVLKINVTQQGKTIGEGCGAAEYRVGWNVSIAGGDNSDINGWIIQHLRIGGSKVDSQGRTLPVETTSRPYWEAWQVISGKVYPTVGRTNDIYRSATEGPETFGTIKFTGSVRFLQDTEISYDPNSWGESGSRGTRLTVYI